ncbi:hypothetical protein REH81_06650 [Vibrio rotiferianus]
MKEKETIQEAFKLFDLDVINYLEACNLTRFDYDALREFLQSEYNGGRECIGFAISYQEWAQKNDEYVSTVSAYFIYKGWLQRMEMEDSEEIRH